MAGHNKWSKIKHRKAVVDKRRGKVWTKVAKAIMVAARNGGPDPAFNLTLRYAMDEARYANMPRDVIDRAIKKGAGGDASEDYVPVRYEGYAPGGVAVIVDALTDNRTRTITLVRGVLEDHGGNVGASGCVGYMFQNRGLIHADAGSMADERVMEEAIEAGALDAEPPEPGEEGRVWMVTTEVASFHSVREALEKAGCTILESSLSMVPDTTVPVAGEVARSIEELVDALEDLDDVQKVYTNADMPE